MTGCRHGLLPQSLSLYYSDSDSGRLVPVMLAVNDEPHVSNTETASPLSAEPCQSSTSLIPNSDPVLITAQSDSSMQENLRDISVDAASADSMTDTYIPTLSAAVADNNEFCESHNAVYHQICSRLESVEDVNHHERLHRSLVVLLEFFEVEYLLADTSSAAFPLHLLEQYTKLIRDDVGFYSADGSVKFTWLELLNPLLYMSFEI